MAILGISLSAAHVHAVLADRGRIRWAGEASYRDAGDLTEAIARLAAEAGAPVRRARVVFERDVVQLRTVSPAPPIKDAALRRYVALELPRLFRKNGVALVADGARVQAADGSRVLWTCAASEPLIEAVLAGCRAAGLRVEAVGPAAEVLPLALDPAAIAGEVVVPNGESTEVLSLAHGGAWRSRRVAGASGPEPTWSPALAALGCEAAPAAAAYAATRGTPRLDLSPPSLGAVRHRAARRRRWHVALLGGGCWLLAAGLYAARLTLTARAVREGLTRSAPAVDTALALRRDLDAATATLGTIAEAERARSHDLGLLAALTTALGDSAYLISLQVNPDGAVRLVGYAPAATRVLADLEGAAGIRTARFEGPATREPVASRELYRFSIVAQCEDTP